MAEVWRFSASKAKTISLKRHKTGRGVTHVFNSWRDMPPVAEQAALPGSQTNPDLTAARFLLKPGRKYPKAAKIVQAAKELH